MKWSIENIVKMMKEDIRKYNELTGNKAVFEIPVEFNGRLKTTLAYFQYSNKSARKISIGKVIFEDQYTDEQRIDTLKHELAHYIAYQIYGPGQGHNENWASICNIIGCIASPHMQPASAHHNSFILEKAILNQEEAPKEVKKASALWCVEESREMTFKEINIFLNKAANNTSVRQAYYKAVKAAKTEFVSNGYTWRILA